jgi:hypothetical protein
MRTNTPTTASWCCCSLLVLVLLVAAVEHGGFFASAFELPNPFKAFQKGTTRKSPVQLPSLASAKSAKLAQTKAQLLEAVSFTSNGKDASLERQRTVLNLVRSLEVEAPVTSTLLSDPQQAKRLDGVWYLQYTSPSDIGVPETVRTAKERGRRILLVCFWQLPPFFASSSLVVAGAGVRLMLLFFGMCFYDSANQQRFFNQQQDTWIAQNEEQLDSPSYTYKNNGAIGAVGIQVSTANKVTRQIFDVTASRVTNTVEQEFGMVRVEGSFRPSTSVPTRAIVAFDTVTIALDKIMGGGLVLNLGFVFSALSVIKGTKDNGWLETTYLDDQLRIGRGDKGTMFVLTRALDAVQP